MPAQQRSQLPIMILLVLDDVVENRIRSLVAESLQLLAVIGDVPALLNLQPPQRHPYSARAVRQRIRLAPGVALVRRLRTAQFLDPLSPQLCMFQLRRGQVPQYLRAHWLRVPVCQSLVGGVALHLGLPVPLQALQDLLQLRRTQRCTRHACLPAFLLRIAEDAAPR